MSELVKPTARLSKVLQFALQFALQVLACICMYCTLLRVQYSNTRGRSDNAVVPTPRLKRTIAYIADAVEFMVVVALKSLYFPWFFDGLSFN